MADSSVAGDTGFRPSLRRVPERSMNGAGTRPGVTRSTAGRGTRRTASLNMPGLRALGRQRLG
ncbi:hypothetical protein CSC62_04745 [Pseudoxanthomonas jiangsuensis]|nr:hypothetical protein CSC62_04745 [Pseudoxanthomonas jiangsuensis]